MKNFKQSFSAVSLAMLLSAGLVSPGYGLEFPDTGDRGAPSSTAGGGTRGGWCEADAEWDSESLVALMPKNNVSTFAGDQASLLILAAPMFGQRPAEIFVQNAQTNEVVYQQDLTLEDFEGRTGYQAIQIDLPATQDSGAPLLAKNQEYTWEFAIICDANDRARDYFISGLLQSVEPDAALSAQLATADLETKAELYANAGIWQETLMIATQFSESQPSLLAELLISVGLDFTESSTIGGRAVTSELPATAENTL